jgi:hypothetical protein
MNRNALIINGKLSPAMLLAIDLAKKSGGKLIRHREGPWAGQTWKPGEPHVGVSTVFALIDRDIFIATKSEINRDGDPYAAEVALAYFDTKVGRWITAAEAPDRMTEIIKHLPGV